jgi:6-phosphogluconolactonase/glucosamine-6-phosphate isomerase/deaminase
LLYLMNGGVGGDGHPGSNEPRVKFWRLTMDSLKSQELISSNRFSLMFFRTWLGVKIRPFMAI